MAVKRDKNYGTVFWTGTWTTGIDGRFAQSTRQGGRSYFMVSTDRWNPCATDAPWIRMNEHGDWDVVLRGTVRKTMRYKQEAQGEAEQLMCQDCKVVAAKDRYPRCENCDEKFDRWLTANSGGHL